MVHIAKGKDFGPSNVTAANAWEASAKKWLDWYIAEFDRQAAGKFRLAKSLLDSGKRDAAKKWLQEIVEQFPETPTGKQAAEMLKKL